MPTKKPPVEKPAAKKKPTVKKPAAAKVVVYAPPSVRMGDRKVILTVEDREVTISEQDAQQLWRQLGALVVLL